MKGEYRSPEQVAEVEGISRGCDEDDRLMSRRARVCWRGKSGMERGEAGSSLQMYYSEGEIIAGLWFHLILLLLTGVCRRE